MPELETAPMAVPEGIGGDLEVVRRLELSAIRPNTRKAYAGAIRRLESWLGDNDLTDETLALYLGHLFKLGRTPAVAGQVVAAVKRRALVQAVNDPVGPYSKRVLSGFRRDGKDRGRGQAEGLTWDQTDAMAERAQRIGDLIGIRDAALISIMSDGLLRASEASALDVDDLTLRAHLGTFLIRASKTDPEGKGEELPMGLPTVKRITAWTSSAGIESGPLFRPIINERATGGRLSGSSVSRVIKVRAAACGLPGRISSHSIRIGSAQSLMMAGASLVDLQTAGRWKSTAMPALYVRGITASQGPMIRHRYGGN